MTKKQASPAISERAQALLKALIDRYVREGEPVGSRTLARDSGLKLSPATVRNVMADLEELGFVKSPHTSAGRVPTVRGYRFFVDSLLTVQKLEESTVEQLRSQLKLEADPEELVQSASNLLSGITHMAGVVTLPRREHAALRRIDFLPLSGNQVLVIMVVNEREVQNRIIQTERAYSASELEQAANFLNAQFAGKDITAVRETLIADMRRARDDMNQMMSTAVEVAGRLFAEEQDENGEGLVLAGQTNLMEFRELCDVEKLRTLFEAFNQKRDLLHLLDQCISAEGVQIFIGEESGYQMLDECSLVTAPYKVEGEVVGVLGVIGPTRMAYERVIPIVDATARLLGAALNPRG
ncbi:MAG TPA: heat-inducible transcriptional repressor HrcA [Thiotrichales bacterium]|nr:heat-inducible transcriptional repressor HrcA [Thiotrichales bacterium]